MKLKLIALIILMILCLTGCNTNINDVEYNNKDSDDRLLIIYNDQNRTIIVDTETGVQYLRSYQAGIVTMVDENGKPLIYEEG